METAQHLWATWSTAWLSSVRTPFSTLCPWSPARHCCKEPWFVFPVTWEALGSCFYTPLLLPSFLFSRPNKPNSLSLSTQGKYSSTWQFSGPPLVYAPVYLCLSCTEHPKLDKSIDILVCFHSLSNYWDFKWCQFHGSDSYCITHWNILNFVVHDCF